MPSAYKQAFVVTTENGAAVLAVVMGNDCTHGEGLALTAARDLEDCQPWDSAAYPTTSDLPLGARRMT